MLNKKISKTEKELEAARIREMEAARKMNKIEVLKM